MKKLFSIFLMLGVLLVSFSCASTQDVSVCLETAGEASGFWGGILDGILVPFAIIGKAFDSEVAIYNVNNNGFWYDLGYAFGCGGLSFGASKSTK